MRDREMPRDHGLDILKDFSERLDKLTVEIRNQVRATFTDLLQLATTDRERQMIIEERRKLLQQLTLLRKRI